MAKKLKIKIKLPHNYRIITATVLLLFSILFLIYSAFFLRDFFLIKQKEKDALGKLYGEKQHWERVVAKYPDYRDGYYQLAIIEYSLGNKEQAKYYLVKTFEIDANFEEGKELEKILKD